MQELMANGYGYHNQTFEAPPPPPPNQPSAAFSALTSQPPPPPPPAPVNAAPDPYSQYQAYINAYYSQAMAAAAGKQ